MVVWSHIFLTSTQDTNEQSSLCSGHLTTQEVTSCAHYIGKFGPVWTVYSKEYSLGSARDQTTIPRQSSQPTVWTLYPLSYPTAPSSRSQNDRLARSSGEGVATYATCHNHLISDTGNVKSAITNINLNYCRRPVINYHSMTNNKLPQCVPQ
jgi:hypothetical protein